MRARAKRSAISWRCAASCVVALAASLVPASARADDAQQLELVKGLFYAGQYEDVLKRLVILLDPSNPACSSVEGAPTTPQTCHFQDAVLIERGREMEIVALVALKRDAEADAAIEKMLRQNPTYVPDPAVLPAAAVTRVRDIKTRLEKEMEDKARKEADDKRRKLLGEQKASDEEKKWIADLEALASKETIIEKRSRLVAFMPFGVGQFQNGDVGWGIFFAASEALTGGGSVVTAGIHGFYGAIDVNKPDPTTGRPIDDVEIAKRMQELQIANNILFATWASITIAGILQANLAYVPEKKIERDRPLPKRPDPPILPTVTANANGFSVGLIGAF
ncbi:MAG: hypothetical protein U0441_33855 [Polyangiaceae bacterium]